MPPVYEGIPEMTATILVLEDDRPLMEGIRDMLELQGYRILTAINGVEGLRVMQNSPTLPDLIVSDIMMPEMDGYQFLEAVQSNSQWVDIPFIFLTAKGEKEDVREGRMLGADDYVIKPFEADDLVVRIASKLRRSRQLRQTQETRVTDIKRRILTILHHEFRTPLTYVVAYSDLLNRDLSEMTYDDIKEFLGGVNSGAERLRRLVENFILLVELETGEAASTFAWRKRPITDIASILTGAQENVQPFAAERGIALTIVPPNDLPPIVGDAEYLKIVLTRLLDNAIKFSDKPNPTVTLSATLGEKHVYFHVADNGRGIPTEEQPHIFEVFYQIDRQKFEDQGAGAGLAIVRRIVDLHEGIITVQSVPGNGATFTVGIPLAEA
ncbi:MAG: sensor histidine kinase [Chloroflexi bacterium CFX4]|nr:sensor histidine kinase [Chloroflexi bacterium CFX4]MDL1921558.1 HAMP domain-containing histidine kinase [Chloroflexi bacterium CFX3]